MKRRPPFSMLVLVAALSHAALAASSEAPGEESSPAPRPIDCLVSGAQDAVASAEYGGKTYYFRSQTCKVEFLTDPERFSQLYDALQELKAEGKPLQKPKPNDDASMVPS